MPFDYALWDVIEAKALANLDTYVTKDEYIKRLWKAAASLRPAYLERVIGSMHRRVRDLIKSKGEHLRHD
jgi:hypothetical protein